MCTIARTARAQRRDWCNQPAWRVFAASHVTRGAWWTAGYSHLEIHGLTDVSAGVALKRDVAIRVAHGRAVTVGGAYSRFHAAIHGLNKRRVSRLRFYQRTQIRSQPSSSRFRRRRHPVSAVTARRLGVGVYAIDVASSRSSAKPKNNRNHTTKRHAKTSSTVYIAPR